MGHLGSNTSPGAVSQVQKSLVVSHSSGDSNALNFGMQEHLQSLSNIISNVRKIIQFVARNDCTHLKVEKKLRSLAFLDIAKVFPWWHEHIAQLCCKSHLPREGRFIAECGMIFVIEENRFFYLWQCSGITR